MRVSPLDSRNFRARLLRWFRLRQRPLPWRKTRDPYRIWISEIMLQQTRVAAVLKHYREFLRRFPDVGTLAAAPLDQVLAAWSGLGYYRRARALHQAARRVMQQHEGRLPRSSRELRALPGIGRYTAAAIASIAFGEPCAVLDGNVERVLRRVLGRPKARIPELWAVAETLLSRRSPGQFNQALMELGAMVCLPAQPRCSVCPVRGLCAANVAPAGCPALVRSGWPTLVPPGVGGTGWEHSRPASMPRQIRHVAYALHQRRGRVYLVRRGDNESLMPGLWELPMVPHITAGVPQTSQNKTGLAQTSRSCSSGENRVCPSGGKLEFRLHHAITTTDYHVSVIRLPQADISLPGGRWVRPDAAVALPLTGLARKILRRAGLI